MCLYVLKIFIKCHNNKINNEFENLIILSFNHDVLILFNKITNLTRVLTRTQF